jgi:chromosome partitioning protein
MRRIAVINQKGGVGKTTTAVNLGAALARLGTRTLILDLDPQCNLTVHVDVDPAGEQPSVYDVLRGEATLAQAVRPTREPNLSVLPSSVDLAGVELELVNVVGREVLLRDAFEADAAAHGGPRWDVVLCDCPPSLGLLSLNALVLCDEVIVPVQSEFFALQGLSKLTEIVDLVQRRLNPRLRLTGLLSCRHDSSTNLGRQVMDDIRSHFGEVLFRSAIRRNVKLAEAPSHGKTIFEYDAESRGAADYLALARELLDVAEPVAQAAASVVAAAPVAHAAKPTATPRPVVGTPGKPAVRPALAPTAKAIGKPVATPVATPAVKSVAKAAPVAKSAPAVPAAPKAAPAPAAAPAKAAQPVAAQPAPRAPTVEGATAPPAAKPAPSERPVPKAKPASRPSAPATTPSAATPVPSAGKPRAPAPASVKPVKPQPKAAAPTSDAPAAPKSQLTPAAPTAPVKPDTPKAAAGPAARKPAAVALPKATPAASNGHGPHAATPRVAEPAPVPAPAASAPRLATPPQAPPPAAAAPPARRARAKATKPASSEPSPESASQDP